MVIDGNIKSLIERALIALGMPRGMVEIQLEHPSDITHGDYSTNVAFLLSKQMGATVRNPVELAKQVVEKILEEKNEYITDVKIAGPGFINFYLSKEFFVDSIADILEKNIWYGKNTKLWNKKIIIEHTNLNPFKPFHIGHVVNNAVGESLSRIVEFQTAALTRSSYGGDVGLHIAKALWGMMNMKADMPKDDASAEKKTEFLGKAYVAGNDVYETDEKAKKEIVELNKKVFEKSDQVVNKLYQWGREASLEYFEQLYKRLNSSFQFHFYESEIADNGIKIVREGQERGIFRQSEGATIFPGSEYGLHDRVFINSQGLPTYEAKELGLTERKFEIDAFDESIVVTDTEQSEYFKVVLKAIEALGLPYAGKTKHLSHGFLRLSTGKMSSRAGNVITGESFLTDIEHLVKEKIEEREMSDVQKKEVIRKVALGAIRYSILRQSISKDIIFDPEQSISFEGDSGPYLQYAYVRTRSILKKAEESGISMNMPKLKSSNKDITFVEKLAYRFPEIVERAGTDFAPSHIATYLIELAGAFSGWYASTKIVDRENPDATYNIALTEAVGWILKNGLWLLGIDAPERM